MKWLEASVAFRGFRPRKKASFISFTGWITLCGISVGVMSLIVVMSVMNGFERELKRNIVDSQAHVLLYRKELGIQKWRQLKSDIKKVHPDILGVLPITYNEVLFIHDGRVQGGILEGVEPSDASILTPLVGKDLSGRNCYLGEEIALKLNAKKGDTIKILLPKVAGSPSPKIIELKMAGTFESGLYEYSSRYVYANLSYVQKQLGWKDRIAAFKLKVKHPEEAVQVSRKVRTAISFPFFIRTWMHMNRNLFLAIQIQKVVMAIILAAIICVAIFNVVSSLIMIVIEKTKDISILKAVGMKRSNIAKIFLWKGAFMGVTGTVAGVLLAFGMCAILSHFRFIKLSPEIYYLSYLPVEIRLSEVLAVSVSMVVVSIIAAFFPARRAAKLYPVEGIRYE